MWEMLYARPLGSLLKRNILTWATAMFVAVFGYVLFAATPVSAADAEWKDGTIVYQGDTYNNPDIAEEGNRADIPIGSTVYYHEEGTSKLHIIYFAPNAQPATAETALYTSFDLTPGGGLSNKSAPVEVTFEVSEESQQQANAPPSGTGSGCEIEGIGWIICPITTYLAKGMDWVFNIISGMVAVRNLDTTADSPMHRIWSVMLNIANVAFIIAFIVIIYSHITSMGVDAYGIKKLFPRLIVAAILVNLSYWLCAMAIDLSNILGHGLQQIFVSMRSETMGISGNTWQITSWEAVTAIVLAGGGAGIAGVAALAGGVGAFSVTGVSLMLVPTLLGALITVLVVFVILAARQAIITLLTIISPLAFAANILPGTDKWFKKWLDLFITMMVFFPLFSMAFGGAQLAGLLIIQNAADIWTVIFGMAVQIAPLAITPLLLKLSGTLLSRIAGLVNNPGKGLVDRTKNWSKDRLAAERAKQMKRNREMAQNGQLRPRHAIRNMALAMDDSRRLREGNKKIAEQDADSMFTKSAPGQALHEAEHSSTVLKTTVEHTAEKHLQNKIRTDAHLLKAEMNAKVTGIEAELAKDEVEVIAEGLKAGLDLSSGGTLAPYVRRGTVSTRNLSLSSIAKAGAKRAQDNNLSRELLENTATVNGQTLREYAGRTDLDNGEDSALTFAVTQKREAIRKIEGERMQLANHFKLNGNQRQTIAMGTDVTATDDSGLSYTFKASDEYTREAIIEQQLKIASMPEKLDIIAMSGTANGHAYRKTISDAIPANGLPNGASFLGGQFIDLVNQGVVRSEDDLVKAAAVFIKKGKWDDEAIARNDAEALKIFHKAMKTGEKYFTKPEDLADFVRYKVKFANTANNILTDSDLTNTAKSVAKDVIAGIRDDHYVPPPTDTSADS